MVDSLWVIGFSPSRVSIFQRKIYIKVLSESELLYRKIITFAINNRHGNWASGIIYNNKRQVVKVSNSIYDSSAINVEN